jgi:hypothetical protein
MVRRKRRALTQTTTQGQRSGWYLVRVPQVGCLDQCLHALRPPSYETSPPILKKSRLKTGAMAARYQTWLVTRKATEALFKAGRNKADTESREEMRVSSSKSRALRTQSWGSTRERLTKTRRALSESAAGTGSQLVSSKQTTTETFLFLRTFSGPWSGAQRVACSQLVPQRSPLVLFSVGLLLRDTSCITGSVTYPPISFRMPSAVHSPPPASEPLPLRPAILLMMPPPARPLPSPSRASAYKLVITGE